MNSLPIGYTLHGTKYSYMITNVLGQGSFGITYHANVILDGSLGTLDSNMQVAIKEFFMKELSERGEDTVIVSTKGTLSKNYKAKFWREAENLSKLQHPNIVKVLEAFAANDTVYYVMEYIDGMNLEKAIAKLGGMDEKRTVRIMNEVCSAVQFMHDHKMLHLDIKPGNIMLRNNDDAVLIDFGLSKQYDSKGNPDSSTNVGLGTPGYAPIEQSTYHDGKGFPVTMDVYALGGTLFKMLTGVRPPDSSELLNDGFPRKELEAHHVSNDFIDIIEMAMAPMKKDRIQSVAELSRMLSMFSDKTSVDNQTANKSNASDDDGTKFDNDGTKFDDDPTELLSKEKPKEQPKKKPKIIKIKCPQCLATLSVKEVPGLSHKNVTCPLCKHRGMMFSDFKGYSEKGCYYPMRRENGDYSTDLLKIPDSDPLPMPTQIYIKLMPNNNQGMGYEIWLADSQKYADSNAFFIYKDGRKICEEDIFPKIGDDVKNYLAENGFLSRVYWEDECTTTETGPMFGIDVEVKTTSPISGTDQYETFIHRVSYASHNYHHLLLDAVEGLLKVPSINADIQKLLKKQEDNQKLQTKTGKQENVRSEQPTSSPHKSKTREILTDIYIILLLLGNPASLAISYFCESNIPLFISLIITLPVSYYGLFAEKRTLWNKLAILVYICIPITLVMYLITDILFPLVIAIILGTPLFILGISLDNKH